MRMETLGALSRALGLVVMIMPRAVLPILLLAFARNEPSWAQTVRGTVLDAESGAFIEMVDVTLLLDIDSVVSRSVADETGQFVVRAPNAGEYRLRATRLGYATTTTDAFMLAAGRDTVIVLRLPARPVPLDPMDAVVECRVVPRLVRMGFYRRQARGFGYFLTPDDLEALHPVFLEDLFWNMPGVRMRRDGRVETQRFYRPCSLSVAVDALVVSNWTAVVHVGDIEAIEVYPSPAGVPAWLFGPVSPCGAVVIWTRGHLP